MIDQEKLAEIDRGIDTFKKRIKIHEKMMEKSESEIRWLKSEIGKLGDERSKIQTEGLGL